MEETRALLLVNNKRKQPDTSNSLTNINSNNSNNKSNTRTESVEVASVKHNSVHKSNDGESQALPPEKKKRMGAKEIKVFYISVV